MNSRFSKSVFQRDVQDTVRRLFRKELDELYVIANKDSDEIKEAVQKIVPTYVIAKNG